MKEQIEEIAKKIKAHRELEVACERTNRAIGRVGATYENLYQQFWITNVTTSRVEKEDIWGNVIPGYGQTQNKPCEDDGKAIYKNSGLGEKLITNHEGIHRYKAPKGDIILEIFSQTIYSPTSYENEGYATDIIIKIAGENKSHTYRNLAMILALQLEIEDLKAKTNWVDEEEAKKLRTRIDEKEAEKKRYLDKAEKFVRRYAKLRYQPILDPNQEKIKRSKVFDGPLIINGGPGTGKTTSLIQRIKFLTSPTINEYKENLTRDQKEVLFDPNRGWIFYSPSELLALFLRDNMTKEGLLSNMETVKVWSNHKNDLVKSYNLINTETRKPFMIYNKADNKVLFNNTPESINNIIEGFKEFYFSFQREKFHKVIDIETDYFKWKNTGNSIKEFILVKKDITNIEEWIRLFLNLTHNYKKESDKISEDYSVQIKQVASKIQVLVNKNQERIDVLSELFKQWKNEAQTTDDEEDEGDVALELEDFEELEEQMDFEGILFSKLKSLCRKQALKIYDGTNTRLNKRDRKLLKLIPEAEKRDEYEQIGQAAYFKKYFERLTKGIVANVLREIPMIYKKYRREQMVKKNINWDASILTQLVSKDKNSRIHPEEIALLLCFINEICYKLATKFSSQFDILNHPYINAYKKNCRPVIGIDEATDFSIIDLLTMNSFVHPLISSVTLSGDIMQCMTNNGIRSWTNFSDMIPNTVIDNLDVSYRQSPTLLSLARTIYEHSTGQKANYTAFIDKDEAEPTPLMLISENEDEKQEWIAARIIEIYKAYGNIIPAIAIFLPAENQLDTFASNLAKIDILADVGIDVKACKDGNVLGDKNCVRVFAIDKIKGLEFEAVFFHNLDELEEQHLSNDLLLKYLYVGLSRATFYLGLTISDELPEDMKFLEGSFDTTGKIWTQSNY